MAIDVEVLYEDHALTEGRIAQLVGRRSFGEIRHRRRRVRELAEAVLPEGFRLGSPGQPPDASAATCSWPARIAVRDGALARQLLERLRLAREAVRIPVGAAAIHYRPGGREPGEWIDVAASGAFVDLGSYESCLEFFSSANEPRHFNQITFAAQEVVKRSRDADKVRRESRVYGLLPEAMRPWFVETYGFRAGDGEASYRMRRYLVPDMSVQWVHNAIDDAAFERFLDDVLAFLASRDRRPAAPAECEAAARRLYRDKVSERLARLTASPHAPRMDALLEIAGRAGGVRALAARYDARIERRWPAVVGNELAIGHGDLCFSNILYERDCRLLKLIDPSGVDEAAELWTHPLYDVAKLSHSVLGDYDWINQDDFEIAIGTDLAMRLEVGTPPEAARRKRLFVERLEREGYDVGLVRLLEASLFLSMLPLHLDHPRKVAAFALRAGHILDELDRNDA